VYFRPVSVAHAGHNRLRRQYCHSRCSRLDLRPLVFFRRPERQCVTPDYGPLERDSGTNTQKSRECPIVSDFQAPFPVPPNRARRENPVRRYAEPGNAIRNESALLGSNVLMCPHELRNSNSTGFAIRLKGFKDQIVYTVGWPLVKFKTLPFPATLRDCRSSRSQRSPQSERFAYFALTHSSRKRFLSDLVPVFGSTGLSLPATRG
jgi:hypothetical protein